MLSASNLSEIDPPADPIIDLEYTDDIILFAEADQVQLSDRLELHCKHIWVANGASEVTCINARSNDRKSITTQLVSFIILGGFISHEILGWIRKSRWVFANLHHLWCRRDVHVSTKGQVFHTAVRCSIIWMRNTAVRRDDMHRLLKFDQISLKHCSCILGPTSEQRWS